MRKKWNHMIVFDLHSTETKRRNSGSNFSDGDEWTKRKFNEKRKLARKKSFLFVFGRKRFEKNESRKFVSKSGLRFATGNARQQSEFNGNRAESFGNFVDENHDQFKERSFIFNRSIERKVRLFPYFDGDLKIGFPSFENSFSLFFLKKDSPNEKSTQYEDWSTIDWLSDLARHRLRNQMISQQKKTTRWKRFVAYHDAISGWFGNDRNQMKNISNFSLSF